MVDNEQAFRLLYGRDAPDDPELGAALRRVEDTIAQAIDPLIDADLDPAHRLLLAHAVVGMAEGASRHWLSAQRQTMARAPELRTGRATMTRRRCWPRSWPTSPGPACATSTGSERGPSSGSSPGRAVRSDGDAARRPPAGGCCGPLPRPVRR